jgi:3-deoxy-D-manno-octulosonic-acid transferase
MRVFYGLGVRIMYALMWCVHFFHPKAKKWILGRKTAIPTLSKDKVVYWFHCASLGEFDQGLPIMNKLKEKNPSIFLVVTFFSPSGMDNYHKRDHKADLVLYLPLDTKSKAQNFIDRIHPEKVFFVKYEFWYNHLKAARRSGAKIYGVSSLFRPSHRFFKWYGGFFRKALALFDHFFCQDQRSFDLLKSIGISQASVTGDSRYDRMIAVRDKNEPNPKIEAFIGQEKVLLLGSSWPVEEELFKDAISSIQNEWKIIIAPHDISENHIQSIEKIFPNSSCRYTQEIDINKRILIVDTIGQLTNAYRYATVAYVGGGFTGKLHNILEPGAFGVPVLIGPKHERFPEAELFISRKCAQVITDADSFKSGLAFLNAQKEFISQELNAIFQENSGTATKICASID